MAITEQSETRLKCEQKQARSEYVACNYRICDNNMLFIRVVLLKALKLSCATI